MALIVYILNIQSIYGIYLLSYFDISIINSNFAKQNNGYMDINRFKLVLVEKKMSGKELAQKLGKDPSIISKWCQNKSQPNLALLPTIAKILDVDPRELINGNKEL